MIRHFPSPKPCTYTSYIYAMCSVTVSCLTLCDPMDYSPPDSSVHGIFQARILEWVAISYSRGPSQPSNWTLISCIFCIGRRIFYHCVTWKVYTLYLSSYLFLVVDTADAAARYPFLAGTTLCFSEGWMLMTNKDLPCIRWKSLYPGGYTLLTHTLHPTLSLWLRRQKPAVLSPSGSSSGDFMFFKLSIWSDEGWG